MTAITNIAVVLFIIIITLILVLVVIAIIIEGREHNENRFRLELAVNIHNQIKEHGFYAVFKEFNNMLDDESNRNKWFDDQMEVLTVQMTSSEVFKADIIIKYKNKELFNRCTVDCSGKQSEITLQTIK